jgi:hypothetical protein
MDHFDRRGFLGLSAGALSFLQYPMGAFAQTANCVSSGMPGFLPNRLTVDCASRKNFQLFRANPNYVGLAGVVSMTTVRGKWGTYEAGNLFLFPWLKKEGLALGAAKNWGAVFPLSATQYNSAGPIPGSTLPLDEYFCRVILDAPWKSFIGFSVDVPHSSDKAKRPWYSNSEKLADGKAAGIGWTSHNMNAPWFGGSQWIPKADTCNGSTWRKLIADGLNQATVASC